MPGQGGFFFRDQPSLVQCKLRGFQLTLSTFHQGRSSATGKQRRIQLELGECFKAQCGTVELAIHGGIQCGPILTFGHLDRRFSSLDLSPVLRQAGQIVALVTAPDIYEYEGYRFVIGPARLLGGNIVAPLQGRRFQATAAKWRALSKKQREATRVQPPPRPTREAAPAKS